MSDHPALILDAPLFAGIEQEGPRKGMSTLFVAGRTVTVPEIEAALRKTKAEQVYLGSGRLSSWSPNTLEVLLRNNPKLLASVETASGEYLAEIMLGIPAPIRERCLFVVTLLMIKPDNTIHSVFKGDFERIALLWTEFPDNVLIKLDTGTHVHVLSTTASYTNDFLSGYAEDVRV